VIWKILEFLLLKETTEEYLKGIFKHLLTSEDLGVKRNSKFAANKSAIIYYE
jgi:hypothetical protein